ncbi:MAG: hypothetical protein JNK46_05635 [Methylobacteriaceae bacterium]|nr:hypothetical protein [Methylobacteriaceae bacterium]
MSTFTRMLLGALGVILLLPGVCALGYIGDTVLRSLRGEHHNAEFFGLLLFIWAVSLAMSAAGVGLLRRVRSAS